MPSDETIREWRDVFRAMWGNPREYGSGFRQWVNERKNRNVYSGTDMRVLWDDYLKSRQGQDMSYRGETDPATPPASTQDFLNWLKGRGGKPAGPEAIALFDEWVKGSGGQTALQGALRARPQYSPTKYVPGQR